MIRSSTLAAVLTAVALTLPAAARAQDSATVAPTRSFCFNGARLPKCRTFVIAEMQGVMNLTQTTRAVRWSYGPEAQERLFQDRPQWEVGLMHNVSEDWAVGGAARLGPGTSGALTGLTARGRRWINDAVAVDVSAGATFVSASGPGWWGEKAGFVGDARLNFKDDAYVGLRFEQIPLEASTTPQGEYDAGGEQRALSLLLGVGSEWALGSSAALGVGLLYLLTTVDWS